MPKKLVSLLVVATVLLTMITACGHSNDKASKDQPIQQKEDKTGEKQQTGDSKPADKVEGSAPLKLAVMTGLQVGAELSAEMDVIAELEKRTNTKLEFTNVPMADLTQKIQTTIASGNLPDIMEFFDYTEAAKYADSGVFIQLDSYIDEVGPNIKKLWDQIPGLEKCMKFDDGYVYVIPRITERVFMVHNMINNSWLEECGLEMPTNLDEFYNVLKAFKDKYGNEAVPFGVGPWAGIRNAIYYAYNVPLGFWLYEDGSYLHGIYEKQQQFKDAVTYLAKLYKEGLIEKQMFSITDDEKIKKIRANQVGYFMSWADGYSLWGKGGEYGTDFIPAPPLAGPDGQKHDVRTNPMDVPFYITKSCKDPKGAVKFFDYLFTEEGIELMNWGLGGVTYSVKNGEKTYTDMVINHEQGPIVGRYCAGLVPPHFVCYTQKDPEYLINNPLTKEHEKYMEGCTYPLQPTLTGTEEENARYTKIMGDINLYINDCETKFIIGEMSIDKNWDSFISQLEKMGIQEAIEIRKAMFERWKNR